MGESVGRVMDEVVMLLSRGDKCVGEEEVKVVGEVGDKIERESRGTCKCVVLTNLLLVLWMPLTVFFHTCTCSLHTHSHTCMYTHTHLSP